MHNSAFRILSDPPRFRNAVQKPAARVIDRKRACAYNQNWSDQFMELYAALLAAVMAGDYEPGGKLPSERELAERYGMSRPLVREELRKLEAAGLVRSVHGSGTQVLDWMREGTLELLPHYLSAGAPGTEPARLLRELLRLRVLPCAEIVRLAASYARGTDIAAADAEIDAAWEQRRAPVAFALADLEMFRRLAAASGFPPALWLLNSAMPAYRIVLERFAELVRPPPDYRARLHEVTALVAKRQGAKAAKKLTSYFEKHDRAVLHKLGIQEAA